MKYLRCLSFLFALSLCCSSAYSNKDPQLRSIMEKHVRAMGGWKNWNKVESLRFNGTIEREGNIVEFCIIKKRPNQIRATITMPIPGSNEELEIIRAHDGKNAWTATRLNGSPEIKKQELPSSEAEALRVDAGVLPKLIQLWQNGAHLQIGEKTSIDQEPIVTIHTQQEETSASYTFYISLESYQVVRYTQHGPNGKITTTELQDYIPVEKVVFPMLSLIEDSTTGSTHMKITSVELGVGIYHEYFTEAQGSMTANK